jgi:dihydroflavonol-4-reductase
VKALVTGATGKVGHATAVALLEGGHEVRALLRDPDRAASSLPAGVEPVRGDVTDPSSLDPAVDGCELVFNAMGLPEQWLADQSRFEFVNARGTQHVVEAAARAGVRRVVHTSTIDVFDADAQGRLEETRVATRPKGTVYERSKQHAEELALAAADGVEVVFVNPAAVYGPGPSATVSLDEQLFAPVARGRRFEVPALPPGGLGVVYSPGVGAGQLLAAERGVHGERYILCDCHVSFRELAEAVVAVTGRGRVPPTLPVALAKAMAAGGEAVARLIGRPPLLARGQLHFLLWNAAPQSGKAQRELGWEPTPLETGVRENLAAMGLA